MASEKQAAANRRNAQKSTGPKTPEGRSAVRLNGVKHGLTATSLILPGEVQSDFESLLDSLEAEHSPATPTEEALVRQMAMAQWRLRRLYHMETGYIDYRIAIIREDDEDEDLDDAGQLGIAAYKDANGAKVLINLSRIESRLERSFYKALDQLQRLRARREENLTKQTQSDPEPVHSAESRPQTIGNDSNVPPAKLVASADCPSCDSRSVSIPQYTGRYPASLRSPFLSCSSAPS
jgi:hypothetical protein